MNLSYVLVESLVSIKLHNRKSIMSIYILIAIDIISFKHKQKLFFIIRNHHFIEHFTIILILPIEVQNHVLKHRIGYDFGVAFY
jgi:hypothetical protein